MSQKKHIDRLFQEKFKDFEVNPDPSIWKNIEKKLATNDQNKTVLPIWYKIAGIVALVVLSLTTGILVYNSNNSNNTETNLVDNKEFQNEVNTPIIKNTTATNKASQNNKAVNTSSNNKTNKANQNETSEPNKFITNDVTANTNNTNSTTNSNSTSVAQQNNSSHIKNENSSTKINASTIIKTNKEANDVTQNKSANQLNKNSVSNTNTNNTKQKTQYAINPNKTNTISKQLNSNQSITNSNSNGQSNYYTTVNSSNSKTNQLKSRTTNRVNQLINLKGKTQPLVLITDSLSSTEIVIKDGNSIEKAIEDYEKHLTKEAIGKRWTIAPNIAPVYYNSFGKGSQFGNQFRNNDKTGETNTSYGLKVGFALNDHFVLRSGISQLNLSYDTDDVIVFESIGNEQGKPLQNIDFYTLPTSSNLTVISGDNLFIQQINSGSNYNAALSQRINYLEIPLELEYKLNKKRFGVNIIGGFSTFVLQENQIVSEFDGYKTTIGEANNINNISFSTNIGIGLNYKFSKSFVYNFEPTFKYQINGFSNTAGSFNPYIIGVYTGFSYKF